MKKPFREAADARLAGLVVDEALRRRLHNAWLQDCTERKSHHRLRPALALTFTLLLISIAAFALTSGFGLLDLLHKAEEGRVPIHSVTPGKEKQSLASWRFAHTEVEVKEAIYDGRMLRVLYSVRDVQATSPLQEPGTELPYDYDFTAAKMDGISWNELDYCTINGQNANPAGTGISIAGPMSGQALTLAQFDVSELNLQGNFQVLLPLSGQNTPEDLSFIMSASDLPGVHELPLPAPLVDKNQELRLVKALFSPIRIYVDLEITMAAGVPEEVCHEVLWRWTLEPQLSDPDSGQQLTLATTASGYAGNTEPAPEKGDFRHRILDPLQPVLIRIHLEFESPGQLPGRLQLSAGDHNMILLTIKPNP